MFTRQASQVQNAVRNQFGSVPTAQDMVLALCNCAQTLEHRGPLDFSFTDPYIGTYPGIQPPAGLLPPPRPGVSQPPPPPGVTLINFPPWNPIPWNPLPPVDWPVQYPIPQDAGGINATFSSPQYAVNVAGDSHFHSVDARTVVTENHTTEQFQNFGDTYTFGDTYVSQDTYVGGDTIHQGDTVHEGNTTHEGDTIQEGDVVNEGPQTHLSEAHHYGQNFFYNPVFVAGGPIRNVSVVTDITLAINGCDIELTYFKRPIQTLAQRVNANARVVRSITANRSSQVVTNVTWDAANKKFVKTTRTIEFFGCDPAATANADVFVAQGAKFDSDNCEIAVDAADPPEYTPIIAP